LIVIPRDSRAEVPRDVAALDREWKSDRPKGPIRPAEFVSFY